MQRRELPQVGHVDRGSVSDQQLGHLVVSVGAGVVEGHQAAAQRDTLLLPCPARCLQLASRARPTLCPWRAHRPRGAAGTPPPTLGCNRQQSEAGWSVGPPGPDSSHSEPCTATAERDRRVKTAPRAAGPVRTEREGNREDPGKLWRANSQSGSRKTF